MEQASKIFVLGESGSGKTSSLRNLDPKTTGILNIDKKSLPLAGWRKNYIRVKKESENTPGKMVTDLDKANYVETNNYKQAMTVLKAWEARSDLKTIVLDTITHLVTSDYMVTALGQDYSGYQQMGGHFYQLMVFVQNSSKNIVVFGHTETIVNDLGNRIVKMRSYGKMIDNMVPPSFFTTVLMTEIHREKDEKPKYLFRTQSIGNDPAKSPTIFVGDESKPPLSMYVPNDIQYVLKVLEEFEN